MDYFPPRIGFRIDKNFAVSLIFSKEESVDRSALKDAARFSRFPNILGNADILGRMAQLVGHVDQINQLPAGWEVCQECDLEEMH